MSDCAGLGLELVYVALENLHIVVVADDGDADGNEASLAWLLVLAADMQGAITEYWQALDVYVAHGSPPRGVPVRRAGAESRRPRGRLTVELFGGA